jgi:hypothetical protein
MRRQAHDWLRAELTALAALAAADRPTDRDRARQTLRHWRNDPDLAGVRDEVGLAKLPEDERSAWKALWAEVEATLDRPRP